MTVVLNTRPRGPDAADATGETGARALSAALRAAGFEPLDVPLVELTLISGVLDLLGRLSDRHYDGILLSSPNLLPLLKASGHALPEAWRAKPWYLIGPRARAEVEALGARVAFVPDTPSLDGFLREFPAPETGRLRLIHPCSTKTRLEPGLFAARGLDVHNMAVYEPRCPKGAAAALEAAWPRLRGGAALFASGTAVHHLFAAAPRLARTLATPDGPTPVSIGASTTRALRMYGIDSPREAPTADTAGFLAALRDLFPDDFIPGKLP